MKKKCLIWLVCISIFGAGYGVFFITVAPYQEVIQNIDQHTVELLEKEFLFSLPLDMQIENVSYQKMYYNRKEICYAEMIISADSELKKEIFMENMSTQILQESMNDLRFSKQQMPYYCMIDGYTDQYGNPVAGEIWFEDEYIHLKKFNINNKELKRLLRKERQYSFVYKGEFICI